MSKNNNSDIVELVFMMLIVWFAFQCVFTDNVTNVGHEALSKVGISQRIQELEN